MVNFLVPERRFSTAV